MRSKFADLGDLTSLNVETAYEKFESLLSKDEVIDNVYHIEGGMGNLDCTLIFTNKRMIEVLYKVEINVITYRSYIYEMISDFWITSNGVLGICLVGKDTQKYQTNENIDGFEIQSILAEHII